MPMLLLRELLYKIEGELPDGVALTNGDAPVRVTIDGDAAAFDIVSASRDEDGVIWLRATDAVPDEQPPPPDVVACGADPDKLYCGACIDAYRNGIEPGGTACDARAHGQVA